MSNLKISDRTKKLSYDCKPVRSIDLLGLPTFLLAIILAEVGSRLSTFFLSKIGDAPSKKRSRQITFVSLCTDENLSLFFYLQQKPGKSRKLKKFTASARVNRFTRAEPFLPRFGLNIQHDEEKLNK